MTLGQSTSPFFLNNAISEGGRI